MHKIYPKETDAMLLPQLIQVEQNLVCAAFRLMKLMPAKYTVEKAFSLGHIDPSIGVVETSSGTYALGLGLVCAELRLPFSIVTDSAVDSALRNRLIGLGGKVHIVDQNSTSDNLQALRLSELHRQRRENPAIYWPNQYDNPDNCDAYAPLANQFLKTFGDDFILVGTVGSGGSTSGTSRFLRQAGARVRVVGVDTFGSVLFGLANKKRVLRGLGNSLFPKNLDHKCYDEVHWICTEDAFQWTLKLHREKSLFMGPTTGAAYQVAQYVAKNNPDKTVVFIGPDEGYRYQETLYNEQWLTEQGLNRTQVTPLPTQVENTNSILEEWAYMDWNRRSLNDSSVKTERDLDSENVLVY